MENGASLQVLATLGSDKHRSAAAGGNGGVRENKFILFHISIAAALHRTANRRHGSRHATPATVTSASSVGAPPYATRQAQGVEPSFEDVALHPGRTVRDGFN